MTKPRLGIILTLICTAALLPAHIVRAEEKEPETTLPACGIRYPGGYDPNTVGVVEGRVASVDPPEHGPVALRLEADGENYTVLTAPSWYWKDLKIAIVPGDRVRVKGSKTMGADGKLYLVAREIAVGDASAPFLLRDKDGKPRWAGCGPGGCGKRGR